MPITVYTYHDPYKLKENTNLFFIASAFITPAKKIIEAKKKPDTNKIS